MYLSRHAVRIIPGGTQANSGKPRLARTPRVSPPEAVVRRGRARSPSALEKAPDVERYGGRAGPGGSEVHILPLSLVAAAGPPAGAATTPFHLTGVANGVRRATLADVASVARLSVAANRDADAEVPALQARPELTAPEIALRLLDDLEDGDLLYISERDGSVAGFAHVSGLMVGDGGHLVEVRRVYVANEFRRRGLARQLVRLIQRDIGRRPNPPALRAWAAFDTVGERFLAAVGAEVVRQRWKVGSGGIAVRGVVYGWGSRQVQTARAPHRAPLVRNRVFA